MESIKKAFSGMWKAIKKFILGVIILTITFITGIFYNANQTVEEKQSIKEVIETVEKTTDILETPKELMPDEAILETILPE